MAPTNGRKVRPADLHPPMMLRDGRMAGLVKLHRGDRQGTERQVRAVYAGQTNPPLGESAVVLPEVRFESSSSHAAPSMNGGSAL